MTKGNFELCLNYLDKWRRDFVFFNNYFDVTKMLNFCLINLDRFGQ